MSELHHLHIDDILEPRISLRPVRRNSPEYAELVESIAQDGVLQPILVRPHDGKHEIVEGWQRYSACKEAGVHTIPCHIKEMSDDEVLVYQIKCNAIRPKTQTFEYARRLLLLIEKGASLPELCVLVGKNPQWIRDQLQLNRVCEEARPAFEQGDIPMTSAVALANLPSDMQPDYIEDAITLPCNKFVDKAKEAKRDLEAKLLDTEAEDYIIGATTPRPRAINSLKRELLEPRKMYSVLKASKANTPREGWLACLRWVLMIDTLSIENRKAGRRKESQKDEEVRATQVEWRKLNRSLIDKYVKPEVKRNPKRKRRKPSTKTGD